MLGMKVKQHFLPQCTSCSSVQSRVVRNGLAAFSDRIVTHHTTVRPYHATGLVLVALSYGADALRDELRKKEKERKKDRWDPTPSDVWR